MTRESALLSDSRRPRMPPSTGSSIPWLPEPETRSSWLFPSPILSLSTISEEPKVHGNSQSLGVGAGAGSHPVMDTLNWCSTCNQLSRAALLRTCRKKRESVSDSFCAALAREHRFRARPAIQKTVSIPTSASTWKCLSGRVTSVVESPLYPCMI